MNEYIIVGDTEEYKDCLICVCGTDFNHANKTLQRMLNNPTENDKRLIKNHNNFRIKEIPKEDCWWKDKLD